MSFTFDTFVHLIAGGVGGTIGAIVTCPLEVVKTRQQSSLINHNSFSNSNTFSKASGGRFVIWRYLKHIVKTESPKALFKGLVPNLVGVAPSRAIYFCAYSNVKNFCNENFKTPDTPLVHMTAAAFAGFVSCTATNPIWFVKTRLQLDQSVNSATTSWQCVRKIHREVGILGMYKGLTASYFGITETIIHFVIYEYFKTQLRHRREEIAKQNEKIAQENTIDMLQFMIASAISKTCAATIAYPHEVARTRLRQEGNKYRTFFQTLKLVYHEEGKIGLYRGLGTQLIKQTPNTAITMFMYELIVHLFKVNHHHAQF